MNWINEDGTVCNPQPTEEELKAVGLGLEVEKLTPSGHVRIDFHALKIAGMIRSAKDLDEAAKLVRGVLNNTKAQLQA